MRGWKHSGFNVDNSVRIEAGDHAGMQRLVEYISRCPFSLARMVTLNAAVFDFSLHQRMNVSI
jgi:hypothetical protein